MSSIRFFSLFSLLSLYMLFSTTIDGATGTALKKEKKEFLLSSSSVHSDFFLQPQADSSVFITEKTQSSTPPHYFESTFLVPFDFLTAQAVKKYVISQDINRCDNVSQLLFPFHFFW